MNAATPHRASIRRMQSFLAAEEARAAVWLRNFWARQQNAVQYQELHNMILAWDPSAELLDQWQQEYAHFVTARLAPQWENAMLVSSRTRQAQAGIVFSPGIDLAQSFVSRHGAEFAANMTITQKNALQAMISQAIQHEAMTADNLARLMRPVIGLTVPQAKANFNFWQAAWQAGIESGLSARAAEERAYRMARNYAARQHQYRASVIARTELVTAYNYAAYETTQEAIRSGLLGACNKIWVTAGDSKVCPFCHGLDGTSVGMNGRFDIRIGNRTVNVLYPPAHPQCRCAVAYVEI